MEHRHGPNGSDFKNKDLDRHDLDLADPLAGRPVRHGPAHGVDHDEDQDRAHRRDRELVVEADRTDAGDGQDAEEIRLKDTRPRQEDLERGWEDDGREHPGERVLDLEGADEDLGLGLQRAYPVAIAVPRRPRVLALRARGDGPLAGAGPDDARAQGAALPAGPQRALHGRAVVV